MSGPAVSEALNERAPTVKSNQVTLKIEFRSKYRGYVHVNGQADRCPRSSSPFALVLRLNALLRMTFFAAVTSMLPLWLLPHQHVLALMELSSLKSQITHARVSCFICF